MSSQNSQQPVFKGPLDPLSPSIIVGSHALFYLDTPATMRGITCATLFLTCMSKRSTVLATNIASNRSFLPAASSTAFQPTRSNASTSREKLVEESFFTRVDTVIAKSLEEDELDHWGFVIYRYTYGSQTKWDKFMALVKQESRNTLRDYGTGDLSVFDKMAWTVIEDAKTLDGANLLETTTRFEKWTAADKKEARGLLSRTPRHNYFIYVDEESLESVVDEKKAGDKKTGYFCKVVFPSSVRNREISLLNGGIPADQDPLDEQVELLDCVKKVRLHDLVFLYTDMLKNIDGWYDIYVPIDDEIRWGLPTFRCVCTVCSYAQISQFGTHHSQVSSCFSTIG
jgi:hypothetical protein